MANNVITRAEVGRVLGISSQAVSRMVQDGAVIPSGPDGQLTPGDLAGLEWSHKCREIFGFKLDQLRPFARLIQRDDRETMRRCVFVKRRLPSGLKQWTLEIFAEAMVGNDGQMCHAVARALAAPVEDIEAAFNLERFKRDTFDREQRAIEETVAKEARRLAKARARREKK